MKTITACLFTILAAPVLFAAEKPNIVYIICDDLGYGDVHCLAPETCKIATPGADELAKQGMIFTDSHSGSSVCSTTRYGIMTGRYSWRTRLQKGVVTGFAPSLIAEDRTTVYEKHPEIVERLLMQLESDVRQGRSTDGVESQNDVTDIVLSKHSRHTQTI